MLEKILNTTTWQEWLGVSFSIIQVLLAYRNKAENYLFGILGIILTIYVLFQARLYAELGVNVYYLIMSFWGWYIWMFKKGQPAVPVTHTSRIEHLIAIVISAVSTVVLFFTLETFTDSDVPLLDSLVAAFAYSGMFLMARRKVEYWLYLNVSNIIAIPLLWHKELYMYSILTVILFTVACLGYVRWKKTALPPSE